MRISAFSDLRKGNVLATFVFVFNSESPMTQDTSDKNPPDSAGSDAKSDKRHERSTIAFPYLDLDAAVEVAKAIHRRAGHGSCGIDELAAELGQTISGAFRMKTATAKTFELIDKDARSAFRLSPLGQRMVMPNGEPSARVESFLSVPLYKAIYEKYKGHFLPPTRGLEREMQALGVSSKQTDKARQAFERSAKQAGFFASGDDRLVKPRVDDGPAEKIEEEPPTQSAEGDQQSDIGSVGRHKGTDRYHPFIEGLLQTLPEPGTLWTVEGRAAWLQAAAQNFTLIYKGEGQINVEVTDKNAKGDY